MLRRTLLCAVFACPLALWRLLPAFAFQALYTLCFVTPRHAHRALWPRFSRGPGVGWGRAALALCVGLGAASALHMTLTRLPIAPHPGLSAALRALCVLTGCLLQAQIILRVQRTGRRHYAACLCALAVFIACMQ